PPALPAPRADRASVPTRSLHAFAELTSTTVRMPDRGVVDDGALLTKRRQQRGEGMGRRLYVGNLPYTTGEAELQELFSRAGNVESVRVMRDAATGRARGFAFVEMATDDEAQKA